MQPEEDNREQHGLGAAPAIAEHAEDEAARGPSDHEEGGGIPAIFAHLPGCRGATEAGGQEFLHGWGPGKDEELLVHAVEQPAEGGHDEDEPLIPVQETPPLESGRIAR